MTRHGTALAAVADGFRLGTLEVEGLLDVGVGGDEWLIFASELLGLETDI